MPHTPLLAGAPNFRDMGGTVTRDGRSIRHGLVFRSEGLSQLTENDLEVAQTLGIRLVCDLRSKHECDRSPSRWPLNKGTELLHLDISADVRAGEESMIKLLVDTPTRQVATRAMVSIYRQFPYAFSGKLRALFDRLLTDDGVPMVFHCTAGKDRTGFVSAILLSALGVDREAILEDYLKSGMYWDGVRGEVSLKRSLQAFFAGVPPDDVIHPMMAVDAAYLDAALDEVKENFGSVENYLHTCAGLDEHAVGKLRERLLA
ncbi:protein tyrosine/serine phosphatase [Pseudomonas sp. GM21]|uniref:tyrosine-protein phosphatase n=1 Tax=Pseudomonas sp. GM21 TaxID=1144325 RepID=UPI00027228FA|nr:tyrosine-protein phosphatase [Pseudomonas sp. GM21]EJM21071.1 protein tyrosine/serine phosphatase [Pseudomonas sp. GM21]